MTTTFRENHAMSSSAVQPRLGMGAFHGLVMLLVVAAVVVAPFLAYPLFVIKVLCFALFALSLNLMLGNLGLLSFGHAAYFGLSSYAAAHAAKVWGLTPELAILFGVVVAMLLGAAIGWLVQVPTGVVAGVMAFGAGALISTLAYELVGEAHAVGGLAPTIGGFLAGAVIYVLADLALARQGARARKRSIALQSAPGVHAAPVVPAASAGVGLAVAIGALLDGVPESLVLGLSIADGGAVSIPMLVAVAVSNVPEGLSSAAGMKHEGRTARYVFGVWGGIVLVSGVAAMLGFALLAGASPEAVAVVTTIAAGGIMAMVANTMIPEAFAADRSLTGLWAALGFALAFALYQLG